MNLVISPADIWAVLCWFCSWLFSSVAVGGSGHRPFDLFNCLLVVVGFLQFFMLTITSIAVFQQVAGQRTAERAWIIIRPKNWSPDLLSTQSSVPAPGNVFQAAIKNVGRTPAHLTEIAAHYVMLDKSHFDKLQKKPNYGPPKPLGGMSLVPQESYSETFPLEPRPSLTDEEIQSIQAGNRFLYFYACIEYKDDFGKPHETRIGFKYHFPKSGELSDEGARFRRDGPSAYNCES